MDLLIFLFSPLICLSFEELGIKSRAALMSCFPKQRRFLEALLEPGQRQQALGAVSSRAVQTRNKAASRVSGSGAVVAPTSDSPSSREGLLGGLVCGPSDEGTRSHDGPCVENNT